MSRWASSSNQAAVESDNFPQLRFLADFDFPDGMVRANSGAEQLEWNGNLYEPTRGFGGFSQITEDAVRPGPIVFLLAGVPSDLLGEVFTQAIQGRSAVLYAGVLDRTTGGWVDNPEVQWAGVMSHAEVDFAASTISLTCDDPDYVQPAPRRYTLADHQRDYAGDTWFKYVTAIAGFKSNFMQKGFGYGVIGGFSSNPAPVPGLPWYRNPAGRP